MGLPHFSHFMFFLMLFSIFNVQFQLHTYNFLILLSISPSCATITFSCAFISSKSSSRFKIGNEQGTIPIAPCGQVIMQLVQQMPARLMMAMIVAQRSKLNKLKNKKEKKKTILFPPSPLPNSTCKRHNCHRKRLYCSSCGFQRIVSTSSPDKP